MPNRIVAFLYGLMLGGILASSAFVADALAQSYPDRPLRVVVPHPPGGGADVLARLVAKYLEESLRQPVVVDNRAGAMAKIGMDIVARAPADGYTLMVIGSGPLTNDRLHEFSAISLLAAPSYILAVNPQLPAKAVKEFIALAKQQPGKITYGSTSGIATSHLAFELFKVMTQTDIQFVPYKGVGNVITDLLGNHVHSTIAPPQAVIQYIESGRLHALAVTGRQRLAALPDVPTVAESGVPGYDAFGWFGLLAPSGTPAEIVNKLNQEVSRILAIPDVISHLRALGAEPAKTTPKEFHEFIRNDNSKWDKLIKEHNIPVE